MRPGFGESRVGIFTQISQKPSFDAGFFDSKKFRFCGFIVFLGPQNLGDDCVSFQGSAYRVTCLEGQQSFFVTLLIKEFEVSRTRHKFVSDRIGIWRAVSTGNDDFGTDFYLRQDGENGLVIPL